MILTDLVQNFAVYLSLLFNLISNKKFSSPVPAVTHKTNYLALVIRRIRNIVYHLYKLSTIRIFSVNIKAI